eukprot:scaffold62519_cov34-Prasinocladus_malaysianus.AAC.2
MLMTTAKISNDDNEMDDNESTNNRGSCMLAAEQENVTSPTFWSNAFVLRRGGSPTTDSNDASCVPCFLKEAEEAILAAGKSIHLIANVDAVIAAETMLGQDGKHRRAIASAAAGFAGMASKGGVLRLGSPLLHFGSTFYDTFVSLLRQ